MICATGQSDIPPATSIWPLQANPHAHVPPTACDGTVHGTRNAYWMAFTGAHQRVQLPSQAEAKAKDEL